MPPAIVAAGIAGATTLGGAIISSRAQNKASKESAASTDKALAFSREQEAQRKSVYDSRMAQYTAARNALLQRYGIDVPQGAPGPGLAGAAPGIAAAASSLAGPASPAAKQQAMVQQAPQGMNLASLINRSPQELDQWNDWGRQGIPQA